MEDTEMSWAAVGADTLAQYAPFIETMERWYAARCAAYGLPRDHGEARLAKNVVRDWLITEVAEGRASELVATDLPFVWLNAHFPEELDADRMITALIDWIGWLGGRGLFHPDETARFIDELESTRAAFIVWAKDEALASDAPVARDAIAACTGWLRERKRRPLPAMLAGQAALTAAINLMGDAHGDLRCLEPRAWLERTAFVLIEDSSEPIVREAVDDVIQWYGVTGTLSLKDRNRMHRAVAQAHQRLVRDAQLHGWASALFEAS